MQLYAILCNRLHVITYDILYMIWGWVKTLHPCSWTTAYRRPWVLGGLGGFWGGLITFLAARLTRYSLGLAATLSTLLLHRTLAHAINFFL